VSTTHGNASVTNTTYNTRAVLAAIGLPSTPVHRGASSPLARPAIYAPAIHGESGIDGVTLLPSLTATPTLSAADAASTTSTTITAIATALLSQPAGTPYLIATGPLTNIALLFRAYPQLRTHIAGLSIMGGAVGSGYTSAPLGRVDTHGHIEERFGNWTPWAEFNIVCDPEAAGEVLGRAELEGKTTLCALDLTHLVRGTEEVRELLFADEAKKGVRGLFSEIMGFFAKAYEMQFGIADGPPMHDPLAVYAVLCPEKFLDGRGERWRVRTIAGGERDGQTVVEGPVERGTRIPRGVVLADFWSAVDEALRRAEEAVGGLGK